MPNSGGGGGGYYGSVRKTVSGFTIVELFIVVVVIAILAAISIVAYTGIQNRANDAAIRNDLESMAKKIYLATVEAGVFPPGGAAATSSSNPGSGQEGFPGFTFRPTKAAYYTASQNLFYCTGVHASTGQSIFRIRARSKSGNSFQYSSNGGLESMGEVTIGNWADVCGGMDYPRMWSYGYYNTTNYWNGWTR